MLSEVKVEKPQEIRSGNEQHIVLQMLFVIILPKQIKIVAFEKKVCFRSVSKGFKKQLQQPLRLVSQRRSLKRDICLVFGCSGDYSCWFLHSLSGYSSIRACRLPFPPINPPPLPLQVAVLLSPAPACRYLRTQAESSSLWTAAG